MSLSLAGQPIHTHIPHVALLPDPPHKPIKPQESSFSAISRVSTEGESDSLKRSPGVFNEVGSAVCVCVCAICVILGCCEAG